MSELPRTDPPRRARSGLTVAAALLWAAGRALTLTLVTLTVAQGAVPVAVAWFTRAIVDAVVRRSPGDVYLATAGLAATAVVGAIVAQLTDPAQGQLTRNLEALVQRRLFSAVNAIPGLAAFEQPAFHDRLRLAEQAGHVAPGRLASGGCALLRDGVTLGSFVLALVLVDPRIAALALAAAVPGLVVELRLSRARADLTWTLSGPRRRLLFYQDLHTDVRAAKEIRLFGLGPFLEGRLHGTLAEVNRSERAQDIRELRLRVVATLVGTICAMAGLLLGVRGAVHGQLTVGDVTVVLAALAATEQGLSAIVREVAQLHSSLLLLEHYRSVVDGGAAPQRSLSPDATSTTRGATRDEPPGRIELRDVWFRYGDDLPWVLRGVNLVVPGGTALALVGLNGAGKSTLVKLLCAFYQPQRGRILLDGADISSIEPALLRRRMSAVFQDFMTYDMTFAENVAVGDMAKSGDRPAIEAATRQAGADTIVSRLPNGYDTMLSRIFFDGADEQVGVTLSGGEWQRIAISRALLREDCDVVILDEPSSGLDAAAEHAVHRSLRSLRAGRTSILISHRLNTIRDADVIAVLDDGVIVEHGPHDDLMSIGGRYAGLFTLQGSGYATVGNGAEPVAPVRPGA